MTVDDSIHRDEVARLNRDKLSELLARYPSIYIARKNMDAWRPTEETDGVIEGLEHLGTLRCICTDGLLAWFLRDDAPPFFGHVQHFRWDVPVISFVPYIKENGAVGYFKSVKDLGAPSAYYKLPAKPKPFSEAKPKRKKRNLISLALDLLKQSNVQKNEQNAEGAST